MMNDAINAVPASLGNTVLKFLGANWVNILLIVVGTFALLIYVLQERRKVTEAASLVTID